MIRHNLFLILLIAALFRPTAGYAQTDTLLFTPVAEFPYPAPYSAYTARFDRLARPYIYTANKEYGVIIFDYSNPQKLTPVVSFSVQDFQSLKPTDLVQQGNYLYVSLGDFEGLFPQRAGLAVVDVSDPAQAVIAGQWSDPAFNKGSAAVRVDGAFAFIGAMEKGVIILVVSAPDNPTYLSHVVPDLNWPAPPGPFSIPHARGLALRNDDELWVCFDAGGLRLIDIADIQHPVESAKYMNAALDAVAQPAYNTATIVGDQLFAAVDYCGLDIVDISVPAQPKNTAWANPWNCTNNSWDDSPGHTNQVATACHDSLLFLSGGDSEVIAYSIADPEHPRVAGQFAVLKDSVATWGIDVNDSLVVLTQIWNPLNMPYVAKKGGIRLLHWACPTTTSISRVNEESLNIRLSPVPARHIVQVEYFLSSAAEVHWSASDILGNVLYNGDESRQEAGGHTLVIPVNSLPTGPFIFTLWANGKRVSKLGMISN